MSSLIIWYLHIFWARIRQERLPTNVDYFQRGRLYSISAYTIITEYHCCIIARSRCCRCEYLDRELNIKIGKVITQQALSLCSNRKKSKPIVDIDKGSGAAIRNVIYRMRLHVKVHSTGLDVLMQIYFRRIHSFLLSELKEANLSSRGISIGYTSVFSISAVYYFSFIGFI